MAAVVNWVKRGNLRGPKGDIGDWARGTLTADDHLNNLLTEGKWKFLNATIAKAIGSPISPYGTVEVLNVGNSTIQRIRGTEEDPRVFERGTTSGGASWGGFRRTDKTTKTALYQVSLPGNNNLNEVAPARHVRAPFKIAAQADGFRLYFRNYNDQTSKNYAGDLTFAGVWFGKRAKDSFGLYTNDFAEEPTALGIPTRTTLPDGSYRWVVGTEYTRIEAHAEYLISYGFSTPAGQVTHVGNGGAYIGVVPGAASYQDPSPMTWSQTMPLDVYMTLLVPDNTPVFGYLGSSTAAGVNTTHPVWDSFGWRHAYASGAIPTLLAHSGSAMTSWDDSGDWKWEKARAYDRLDRMYFNAGSNDVYGTGTLEELQDRNNAVAGIIRSQIADQLFYVNIAPRANEDPAIRTKRLAYNEWLAGLPNDALATYGVASVVTGPDGSLADIFNSGDDVHLNDLGQAKTSEELIKPSGGPQGAPGFPGAGVPAGGTALQLLRKNSAGTTTEWFTPSKSTVGLGNVDNTRDADKPLSNAVKAVLDAKATLSEQEVLENVYTYLTGHVLDERGELLPNGIRRSLQLRKPLGATQYTNGDWAGQYQNADGEPVNSTSAGMALNFLATYALTLPNRPRYVVDDVRLFADNILALQWRDPAKLSHGGFRLAPTDSRASTFGTATAARGMLAAYRVTKDSKHMEAAVAAGDFLLRMADPNPHWFAKYGVNPITRTVSGTTWYGFCDRINSADQITTTCTTWNLLAAQYLHELYEETGVAAYETVAIQARDFMAEAVLKGYDYFAVSSVAGTYVSLAWPNDTNHVYADHAFHRLGDVIGSGTVGTDQIEYRLVALWHLGYSLAAVKTAYETYRDLPHDTPTTDFGAAFDAGRCFAGYFRLTGTTLGDAGDRHYGSYYDSQGAGELLAFKRVFYPADYALARQITDIITDRAALLDENLDTIWWTTIPAYHYATQGTIPIAAAGLGILDSINATEGA